MYCLDYAKRPQPDNQLSFMLHKLVFLGYHSQFAPHSYSCKILQRYVAAIVRMHSNVVLSSIGASRMKTVIKK